jgi:hypothetical protein
MENAVISDNGKCDLDSVIATAELEQRTPRRSNPAAESRTNLKLVHELSKSPHAFFETLVQAVLDLSNADSAGISLLDEERQRFVWPAVAGGLIPFIGGGTPRDFGPCGTVLDRDTSILFLHPERYFTYLQPISPPLEEVLLIPFHVDGKAVGTLWAVIHTTERQFDPEDKRLLENLSTFAASAYRVLASAGSLIPLLQKQYPSHPPVPVSVPEFSPA